MNKPAARTGYSLGEPAPTTKRQAALLTAKKKIARALMAQNPTVKVRGSRGNLHIRHFMRNRANQRLEVRSRESNELYESLMAQFEQYTMDMQTLDAKFTLLLSQHLSSDMAQDSVELAKFRQNYNLHKLRFEKYPVVTLSEAAQKLGLVKNGKAGVKDTNATKKLRNLEASGKVFSFEYPVAQSKFPIFQINQKEFKPYPIVSSLMSAYCDYESFDSLTDGFSLYLWFTSPIDSQGKYVPCELLGDTSTHDDLMFYAEQAGARRVGREFA